MKRILLALLAAIPSLGAPRRPVAPADCDGDGRSDRVICYQPSSLWQIVGSRDGRVSNVHFGVVNGVPLTGDIDGDGRADLVCWDPARAHWSIRRASTAFAPEPEIPFGQTNGLPELADFDGDRCADLACYDVAAGRLSIRRTTDGKTMTHDLAPAGVVVELACADFDGDGRADPCVYDPAAPGRWYRRLSTEKYARATVDWGDPEHRAVPADYDGDGRADLALFDSLRSEWTVRASGAATSLTCRVGKRTFVYPVRGDFDGDGRADFAVFRTVSGLWTIDRQPAPETFASPDYEANGGAAVPALPRAPESLPPHHNYIPPRDRQLTPTNAARMVVLGDSIAYGVGASDRLATSWAALLFRNFTASPTDFRHRDDGFDLLTKFGPSFRPYSRAVGGATTEELLKVELASLTEPEEHIAERFGKRVRRRMNLVGDELPVNPPGHTIFVLSIGGNDVQDAFDLPLAAQRAAADRAVSNLRRIVRILRHATEAGGCSIYLMLAYDTADGMGYVRVEDGNPSDDAGEGFGQRSSRYTEPREADMTTITPIWMSAYLAFAKEAGIAFIDTSTPFRGHCHNHDRKDGPYYNAADPSWWLHDPIHPNDLGHSAIRRAFYDAIDYWD